jgi:hypothetical protein
MIGNRANHFLGSKAPKSVQFEMADTKSEASLINHLYDAIWEREDVVAIREAYRDAVRLMGVDLTLFSVRYQQLLIGADSAMVACIEAGLPPWCNYGTTNEEIVAGLCRDGKVLPALAWCRRTGCDLTHLRSRGDMSVPYFLENVFRDYEPETVLAVVVLFPSISHYDVGWFMSSHLRREERTGGWWSVLDALLVHNVDFFKLASALFFPNERMLSIIFERYTLQPPASAVPSLVTLAAQVVEGQE